MAELNLMYIPIIYVLYKSDGWLPLTGSKQSFLHLNGCIIIVWRLNCIIIHKRVLWNKTRNNCWQFYAEIESQISVSSVHIIASSISDDVDVCIGDYMYHLSSRNIASTKVAQLFIHELSFATKLTGNMFLMKSCNMLLIDSSYDEIFRFSI